MRSESGQSSQSYRSSAPSQSNRSSVPSRGSQSSGSYLSKHTSSRAGSGNFSHYSSHLSSQQQGPVHNMSKVKRSVTGLSDTPDIFNQSFYEERTPQGQFFESEDYVKRYLHESGLSRIVSQVVGRILSLDKLPHNPFNMMYRIIHHEAIYENLQRHYKVNPSHPIIQPVHSAPQHEHEDDQRDDFMSITLRDCKVYCSAQLGQYANTMALQVVHALLMNYVVTQKHLKFVDKYNLSRVGVSWGGPMVLNLRGGGGTQGPGKLYRQVAEKSLYWCDSMLQSTVYVHSKRDISKSVGEFIELVLEDVRASAGEKGDGWVLFVQKLQLFNMDDSFNLLEWGREHLLGGSKGTSIGRDMARLMEKENMVVRMRGVYGLSGQLAEAVGERFVTYSRDYMLIGVDEQQPVVLHNQPLKHLMQQFHTDQATIQDILSQQQYQGESPQNAYLSEMMVQVSHHLKTQQLTQLVWQLFYYHIYDDEQGSQLASTLNYLLLSPMAHVHRLAHKIRSARWLTHPAFPSAREEQVYELVIELEREVTYVVQRGQHLYWQLQIFYEAIKRLLSIVVELKKLKLRAILFILDNALLMIEGATHNFAQILLVLQGNLINYVNLLQQRMEAQPEQQHQPISYDAFLKQKQPPTRVLDLKEETKRARRAIDLSESEIRTVLIGKYINKFDLYGKIYRFYWQLFIGHKNSYPLSAFLCFLMVNSSHQSYQYFRESVPRKAQTPTCNKVNGLGVWELSAGEGSLVCYSLSRDALHGYALKEYKTVLDMVWPMLSEEPANDLGYRYGSSKSIGQGGGEGVKGLVAVRRVEVGQGQGEEVHSFHQLQIMLDVLFPRAYPSKQHLHSQISDHLHEMLAAMDRGNMSVVGVFPYHENQSHRVHHDHYVYSKLIHEEPCLRFDYKRKFPPQQVTKFLEYCASQQLFMEVRVLYQVRDIVKTLKISLNYHYRAHTSKVNALFPPSYLEQRVFTSKKDLLDWCHITGTPWVIEQLAPAQQQQPSLHRLAEEREVSVVELISARQQKEGRQEETAGWQQKGVFYRQSQFFNLLQRCLEIADNMQVVIQYLKSDRRGRYDLGHIRKLHNLLQYYLVDRCLVKDDYIFGEGVSVCVVNLMGEAEDYLLAHPDNNGDERELLYLESIVRRLSNWVRFAQIGCSICVQESLDRRQASDGSG